MESVRRAEKILRRSFDKLRNLLRARSLSLSKGRAISGPDAQVIGKRHDAATAVPAHHPAGPVGVVELHGEIHGRSLWFDKLTNRSLSLSKGRSQDHQPVGLVLLAQRLDARHLAERGHFPLAAVDDHEVVARSGELIDLFHDFSYYRSFDRLRIRSLTISPSSLSPGSIFSSAMKEKLSRMVLRWLPSRKKNEPAT